MIMGAVVESIHGCKVEVPGVSAIHNYKRAIIETCRCKPCPLPKPRAWCHVATCPENATKQQQFTLRD